ncbi:MAG TPA: DUF2203 domain-containing protein [Candidatus Eisenbacteria bacterium]|nr:DUF2203 domain-containing protein [Candidatus Eisenbacteria bacterium]
MENHDVYPRLFTVDEANALLPTLRPLVEAILESLRRLKAKTETVIREQRLDPDAPHLMNRLQENSEIAHFIGRIKGLVDEIHRHGCMCKGIEQGLLDFPCMLGSEVVFLCWQYGEPSVSHWHRIEDGFAGRRPLLEANDDAPRGSKSYH